MPQITYTNKVDINSTATPAQNKVVAADMNEIKSVVNSNTPIGSITLYAGSTAPTGWLICDGSAVSRTTYSSLFSVIGTSYGSGDGTTTFNLPNLKGKIPIGLDSNDTDFDTLGETGGQKEVTLSIDQMPEHSHNTIAVPNGAATGTQKQSVLYIYTNAQTYTIPTDKTGSTQPHSNLQPYMVLNYIISY